MNSIQILFLLIDLFLIISLSSLQRVTNKFCTNGQLDTAVRVNNGRIFIFFDSYLTEITESLKVVRNRDPIPIRNYFSGLNFDRIVASFTADGHNNPNRGKTYFINGKEIKEYSGLAPTGLHANMSHWIGMWKMERVNLVVNQIGDSNAIFFDIKSNFTTEDQNNNKRFEMYFFDNVSEPSQISVTKYLAAQDLIEYPLKNEHLIIKAVISLSNNYLIFYNPIDRRLNGKYCFAEKLSEGCKEFIESKSICNTIANPVTSTLKPTLGPIPTTRPTPKPTDTPITRVTRPTTTTRRLKTTKKRITYPKTKRTTTQTRITTRSSPPTTTLWTTTPRTDKLDETSLEISQSTQLMTFSTESSTDLPTISSTTTESPEDRSDDPNYPDDSKSSWLLIVLIVLIVLAVMVSVFWILFVIFIQRKDN